MQGKYTNTFNYLKIILTHKFGSGNFVLNLSRLVELRHNMYGYAVLYFSLCNGMVFGKS